MVWTRWLHSGQGKGKRKLRSRARITRPELEALEDRCLLATRALTLTAPDLLSDTAAGNTAPASALNPDSVSADGRFIVYENSAGNLVPGQVMFPVGEADSITNVFVYDRVTGQNTLVSHSSSSLVSGAHGSSSNPVISDDGNWIAFTSTSDNLVAGQTAPAPGGIFDILGGNFNIYLYNRLTGVTRVVSHVPGSPTTLANGSSGKVQTSITSLALSVSISGGGEYVTYLSTADNLAPVGASPRSNVYVYDRVADQNTLISHTNTSTTTGGNDHSGSAVLGSDGTTLVFTSKSSNLVPNQNTETTYSGGRYDNVFVARRTGSTWATAVKELVTHTANPATVRAGATLVSTTAFPLGSAPFASLPAPSVTPDGKTIAYVSYDRDLVATESAAAGMNVYIYNNDASLPSFQTNVLVSHVPGSPTVAGNSSLTGLEAVHAPSISDDGNYVAFLSNATNLTPTATGGFNVFLYNRFNDQVTAITHADLTVAQVPTAPTISGSGRYLAYTGHATAEVPGLTNLNGSRLDALVYDRTTGTSRLLSRSGASATTTGNNFAQLPIISKDGSTVIYISEATNLLPPTIDGHPSRDSNLGNDLFAYSLSDPSSYEPTTPVGANALVSIVPNGMRSLTANSLSQLSPIETVSDDGRFTVFLSQASNIVSGQVDTNNALDVFLYDKTNNTTTLLSHAAGLAATTGDGNSSNAVISGDGKTIVFLSYATNLITGLVANPLGGPEIYVYDNDPSHTSTYRTLKLVSHANFDALTAASSDGSDALTTPSVSFDGKYIAYLSSAPNLVSGQSSSDIFGFGPFINAFLYNNDPASPGFGTSVLISHTATSPTTTADDFDSIIGVGAQSIAISGDGSIVAFHDDAINLLANPITTNGAAQIYVYRRSTGQVTLASHAASDPDAASDSTPAGFTLQNNVLPMSLSHDGRYTVYYSDATNLVTGQGGTRGPHNVFLYDLTTNSSAVVSHAFGSSVTTGNNPVNNFSIHTGGPVISSNGAYVAYANNSTNLLATPLTGTNGRDNVYLYNVSTGVNTLVSHAAGSATTPLPFGGVDPSVSNDGRYVAFADLSPASTDTLTTIYDTRDIRLYDRLASATAVPALISHAMTSATEVSHHINASPVVNGTSTAGPIIVWTTLAPSLTPRDYNGQTDVFLFEPDGTTPILDINLSNNLVRECRPVNTFIGTLTTSDPEPRATHTYTILPGPNSGLFNISGNSLRTSVVFDVTSTQTYPITIRTTSTFGLTFDEVFNIIVQVDLPPTVTLLSPVSGSTVTGLTVDFYGDGMDDVGVVRGEFYIDNVLRYTDYNSSGRYYYGGAPLLWDTTVLTSGIHTLRLTVYDECGQSASAQVTVNVVNAVFREVNVVPSNGGFDLLFTAPLDPDDLNLNVTVNGMSVPPDITLTGNTTGPVQGSVVVDPTNTRITFTRNGGLLPNDNYTINLRSAVDGFNTEDNIVLGGQRVSGGIYTNTFAVAPAQAAQVSVPDFTRGPGQAVHVPATATGLPITLTSNGGVTSVSFDLRFDTALLNVTSFTRGSALPADAQLTVNTSTPGLVRVFITSLTTPLGNGTIELLRLTANVPTTATYGAKEVLDLSALRVNGGPAADDDGLHVVAYLADPTGNARVTSADATLALRRAVGLETGFNAYPLADAANLSDINRDNRISALDALFTLREAIGIDQATIPQVPAGAPTILTPGPDPLLSIPKAFRAQRGNTLTVPLNLDISEGLENADLALSYDVSRLELVEVRLGSLTKDFDLFLTNVDPVAGTIRAGLGRTAGAINGRGAGSVLEMVFRIRADARPGQAIINLRRGLSNTITQLNEGGLDLNPDPKDRAGDVLDGRILVQRQAQRIDAFFRRVSAGAFNITDMSSLIPLLQKRTGGRDLRS